MKNETNESNKNTNKVRELKHDSAEGNSGLALTSMGINNPDQIARYTLREEGNKDVLKVYYKRKKGSLLPSSRKYKFGRSVKTIINDSGKPEYGEIFDISPFLLEVIAELDKIVDKSEILSDRKKAIIVEIDRLEKTLNSRIDSLREQVECL